MSSEDLDRARGEVDLRLKRSYGRWLLLLLAAQLIAANVLMFKYAAADAHNWAPPPEVMQAWLAATVVELIGVVYVVVSHLFPRNGQ